ncbi:MAG: putative 7-carboxy-7-deazaguanine synthase QueE [Lachnospiraceae bacterium]|nr:putative 7-carboxy-7-deazaguanine synthase QueE [Lachnospiraceae bacterium]
MATYKVVEKFISINGEGTKAGQLAVFIRFAGCNLNCSYCDTAWANKENVPMTEMTEFEIYDYIKSTGVKNVTLTGGEPLLRDDVDKLLKLLSSDKSIKVEIETNGSIDLYDYRQISDNISFTVDYKLPSSCMEHLMEMENFEELEERDTVKFVVSDNNDLLRAKEIIDEYKLTGQCSVYLSPVFGKIDPQEIVDFMIRNHLNGVNLQLQLHKIIWDPDKKGV